MYGALHNYKVSCLRSSMCKMDWETEREIQSWGWQPNELRQGSFFPPVWETPYFINADCKGSRSRRKKIKHYYYSIFLVSCTLEMGVKERNSVPLKSRYERKLILQGWGVVQRLHKFKYNTAVHTLIGSLALWSSSCSTGSGSFTFSFSSCSLLSSSLVCFSKRSQVCSGRCKDV